MYVSFAFRQARDFFFFFFPWNRLSSFDQQSFSVLNVNVVMEDACVMV